jgi:monothiol glutaredoxin
LANVSHLTECSSWFLVGTTTPKNIEHAAQKQVVKVLQSEGVDFASVNVLDYPAIREGVKKFSDWPTIPQLYVDGEFVGGCDIVVSMHESGELKELLKEE